MGDVEVFVEGVVEIVWFEIFECGVFGEDFVDVLFFVFFGDDEVDCVVVFFLCGEFVEEFGVCVFFGDEMILGD